MSKRSSFTFVNSDGIKETTSRRKQCTAIHRLKRERYDEAVARSLADSFDSAYVAFDHAFDHEESSYSSSSANDLPRNLDAHLAQFLIEETSLRLSREINSRPTPRPTARARQTATAATSAPSENNVNNADSVSTCSVCLSDVRAGGRSRKLRCNHSFHVNCLNPWIEQCNGSPTCPTCRRAF
jgi:hypothetical protein